MRFRRRRRQKSSVHNPDFPSLFDVLSNGKFFDGRTTEPSVCTTYHPPKHLLSKIMSKNGGHSKVASDRLFATGPEINEDFSRLQHQLDVAAGLRDSTTNPDITEHSSTLTTTIFVLSYSCRCPASNHVSLQRDMDGCQAFRAVVKTKRTS